MNNYPNNYPDQEEESGGPGWGTLAALTAAGALSTPLARPARRIASNWYQAFGSPFANTAQSLAADVAPIGNVARRAASPITGGAANLAGRSYEARKAAGGFGSPTTTTPEGDVLPKSNPNWEDTLLGAKALGGATADFLRATPAAIKVARGTTKEAGKKAKAIQGTFDPQTDLQKAKQVFWTQFKSVDPKKKYNLNDEDLNMIGKIFSQDEVSSPMEATLQYLRMLKQAETK